MEDYTLMAAKVIEVERGVVEKAVVEPNTARMPVILLHKDLPSHCTCTKNKPSKSITLADTAPHCGGKGCITCKAKTAGQMLETEFDTDGSTVI
eukprot:2226793-Heterocapsa_arctica.AAC.1